MLCPIYSVYHDTAKKYNNNGASKSAKTDYLLHQVYF